MSSFLTGLGASSMGGGGYSASSGANVGPNTNRSINVNGGADSSALNMLFALAGGPSTNGGNSEWFAPPQSYQGLTRGGALSGNTTLLILGGLALVAAVFLLRR